ncbi:MAG TPA: hypothetical protein VGC13_24385 [Longimicrobium sp.]|jgi:hypothetical protein|uniref:hypothetical protein n=1 Tax=Longimicrobium sp. TaxID=2029185 RepID=UPI002ED9E090
MFKRFIPATFAALLVFTACTATPTAAPGTKSSGADAHFDEGIGGYGSGNREEGSGQDMGGVATASADSGVSRGGGAIGSGN